MDVQEWTSRNRYMYVRTPKTLSMWQCVRPSTWYCCRTRLQNMDRVRAYCTSVPSAINTGVCSNLSNMLLLCAMHDLIHFSDKDNWLICALLFEL
jgi:hypothetical protein